MGSETVQRDYTWDSLKFVLIVFVILGHWLEYGLDVFPNRVVFNYIYLFHMPLFIFISGCFSKKKENDSFVKDILHLTETYIIVQILYVLTSYLFQHKPFSWLQLYMPNAAAWYLLSLISWKIILQVLPDGWTEKQFMLPFLLIISLLAGFIPVENELSLQRTLAFMPFFFLGYLLKQKIQFGTTSLSQKLLSVIVLLSVLVVSFFLLNRDISFITWCKFDYYKPSYSALVLLFMRALYLTIATVLLYCVLKVFPRVLQPNLMSRLGSDTLFYYVYHIIVMRLGIIIIRHFHLPMVFPAMLLYTLISIFILFLMGKLKPLRWLLNPISSLKNN